MVSVPQGYTGHELRSSTYLSLPTVRRRAIDVPTRIDFFCPTYTVSAVEAPELPEFR